MFGNFHNPWDDGVVLVSIMFTRKENIHIFLQKIYEDLSHKLFNL